MTPDDWQYLTRQLGPQMLNIVVDAFTKCGGDDDDMMQFLVALVVALVKERIPPDHQAAAMHALPGLLAYQFGNLNPASKPH